MKNLPDFKTFLDTLEQAKASQTAIPERLTYCFGRVAELRRVIKEHESELDLLDAQIPALLGSLKEVSESTQSILGTVKEAFLDFQETAAEPKKEPALTLADIQLRADTAKAEAAELAADEEQADVFNS